jgi:hypothetical protein
VPRTKLVAGAITATLIGAIMIASIQRSPRVAVAPEAVLEQMLQAMQQGDMAAYVACFTGELHDAALRNAETQPAGQFAGELRRAAAAIKGQAILKTESRGLDEVYVLVDRVYSNRPWELQGYRLRRERDCWKIHAIDPAQPHDPPVPYGTPVISQSSTAEKDANQK